MDEEEEVPDHNKLTCVGHESRGSKCRFISWFLFFLIIFMFLNMSIASGMA